LASYKLFFFLSFFPLFCRFGRLLSSPKVREKCWRESERERERERKKERNKLLSSLGFSFVWIWTATVDLGRESETCVETKADRKRGFFTQTQGEREREREITIAYRTQRGEALRGDLFRGASFHFGPVCMLSGTSMDAFSLST
jgi:hypothetical protein